MDQALSHEGSGRLELPRTGRRAGWSESESQLLWELADEAQQQGLPLKAVFEQLARQTGRRPNSIRNYYYAQVRQHEEGREHVARFVPFSKEEVDWLMEQVLVARAEGQSVRACLQKLAGGDHSLMLRYQNKYRAMIKNRPDYVREMVQRLNEQGVACDQPQVNHRARADLQTSGGALVAEARRSGDAELARACDVLTEYLRGRRHGEGDALETSVRALLNPLRDFLALQADARAEAVPTFCEEMAGRMGAVEAALQARGEGQTP